MSEPTGTQYGGFWVRLIALLADSAIVFLFSALLIAGAAMALGPEMLMPVMLAVWIAGALYWPVMHASRRQATFGKSIVGLKVTRFDGRRITILRSLWREIAKAFSAAVVMLGYIMAAFTPRKQALHALMSATYVVREGPARVIPALAVVVAGFALPVFVGPMILGAAVLSSMTVSAQHGRQTLRRSLVSQMLAFICRGLAGRESLVQSQGQGSDGYLSPKKTPDGDEAALSSADSIRRTTAGEPKHLAGRTCQKPAGQSTHAYS
jgi:uncharacterized RDD family membrane protein YckC